MIKYITVRIMLSFATFFIICGMVFFLVQAVPGNPFFSPNMPAAVAENLHSQYYLDSPVLERFFLFFGNVLKFDFGVSVKNLNMSVNDMIAKGFGISATLAVCSTLFGAFLGVILGTISGVKQGRAADFAINIFCILCICTNVVILAPMLQLIFGVKLGWFPIAMLSTPKHYVLPVLCLTLVTAAPILKSVRSNVIRTMSSDFVDLARMKGMTEFQVIKNHVIRNSMLSVVSLIGIYFIMNLCGTFFLEAVYYIPGLGTYLITALNALDYGAILGIIVFMSMVIIIVHAVMDIVQSVLDPRIKTSIKGTRV